MKTLLQLIDETLFDSVTDSVDRMVIAKRIESLIKEESKFMFFKGQISQLISFLCTTSSSHDMNTGAVFQSKIAEKEKVSLDFTIKLQSKIVEEMRIHKLEPNLDGLLTILRLEHLSPMLSIFRL